MEDTVGSIPQCMAAVTVRAWAAHRAGLSVMPPKEDGSKAPLGEWKEYETSRPSEAQLRTWYTNRRHGVGVVTGRVSGNLELLEFDAGGEVHQEYVDLAHAAGLGDVVARIEAGYLERSPSGGLHWLYRCAEITGNTKLARRPKRPAEKKHPDDKIQTLVETKGEGGYVIVAPSFGAVHPSGRPYELLSGSFETITTITPEERKALWELARSFDRMPAKAESHGRARGQRANAAGGRPGDEFNARATWDEVLEPHGWVQVYAKGEATYWRRPGKARGISASIGVGGDWLYVFSTSTPLETGTTYSKFAAFAVLNHGGNFQAAARDLGRKGYGHGPARPFSPRSPSGRLVRWRHGRPVLPTQEVTL